MTAAEGLHQAHQGVVDRLIAMGVVLAKDIAHHTGALAIRTIRGEPQLVHRVKNAPLNGLEAVPHIGQSATHDHAHRVFEIRALHLLMQ